MLCEFLWIIIIAFCGVQSILMIKEAQYDDYAFVCGITLNVIMTILSAMHLYEILTSGF